jgi:hypothetical protein
MLAWAATGAAVLNKLYLEPSYLLAAFLFPRAISGPGMVWLLHHKVDTAATSIPHLWSVLLTGP